MQSALRVHTVTNPPDEVLDLPRADLGARDFDRRRAVEGGQLVGEPFHGPGTISVEKIQRATKKAGRAQEPIRFLGRQTSLRLSSRQRSRRYLNPLQQQVGIEAGVPLQVLERAVRKSALDARDQLGPIAGFQTQNHRVVIGPRRTFDDVCHDDKIIRAMWQQRQRKLIRSRPSARSTSSAARTPWSSASSNSATPLKSECAKWMLRHGSRARRRASELMKPGCGRIIAWPQRITSRRCVSVRI